MKRTETMINAKSQGTLALRRETLRELSFADLSVVVAGLGGSGGRGQFRA
jgi:hypothetical protein